MANRRCVASRHAPRFAFTLGNRPGIEGQIRFTARNGAAIGAGECFDFC
jgi:hypothetical protein